MTLFDGATPDQSVPPAAPGPKGTPQPAGAPRAAGKSLILHFDGGSRGNPGPAGIGVSLCDEDGTPLYELAEFLGRCTNNVAEYRALITAMQEALKLGAKKIIIRGDSELIIKQMRGEYRVKHPDLKPLYEQAQDLLSHFEKSKIEHNYRESNALADKLANLAMDRRQDVTDPDDDGPTAPARPAPKPVQRSSAPTSPVGSSAGVGRPGVVVRANHVNQAVLGTLPKVGTTYACPRCDCRVEVLHPSSQASDNIATFLCVCGVRMKAQPAPAITPPAP